MSDNEEVVQLAEPVVVEVSEVEALRQELARVKEESKKTIDSLVSKKDQLLNETKAAKEEKRRQAELAEQAKREQLSIAEKNGEFEKLYKQAQEEKQSLAEQLHKDRQERRNEKINVEAIRMANDLAKGDAYKAELLSNFIAGSLGKLADDYGRVDGDVLHSIKAQFETDKKYAPLLGGSQAVGGSAPGNTRSAGNSVNEITLDQFSKLNPMQQLEFSKSQQAGKARIIK